MIAPYNDIHWLKAANYTEAHFIFSYITCNCNYSLMGWDTLIKKQTPFNLKVEFIRNKTLYLNSMHSKGLVMNSSLLWLIFLNANIS